MAAKPKKARITQKALGVLHPAEMRFAVIHAGIAEQLDAFRLDPSHWQKLLAGDPDVQKQFLETDLDDPEIKVYVYGPAPAIRESAYMYLRALQAAVLVGGPQPDFIEIAQKLEHNSGDEPLKQQKEDATMRGIKRRKSAKKPAADTPETEAAPIEEEAAPVEDITPADGDNAGANLNVFDAVDEISKQVQSAQEDTAAVIVALEAKVDNITAQNTATLSVLWNLLELDPADFPADISEFPSVSDIAEFLEDAPEE
jgi:hypothetical protein